MGDELDHDDLQKALGIGNKTWNLDHPQQALRINKLLRNYALNADYQSVKKIPGEGNQYEVGQFVELRELVGLHKVSEPRTFRCKTISARERS